MKLRNKKTGEVVRATNVCTGDNPKWYTSIKELMLDYEDVPEEPLIKDDKARNVFREWLELFGAERFRMYHHYNAGTGETTTIECTDVTTEPIIELPQHIGEDQEIYNRIELIGEEK